MFRHVGQSLLHDAVHRRFDRTGQASSGRAVDGHDAAGSFRDAVGEKFNRRLQPEIIEDGRTELVRELSQLRLDLFEPGANLDQVLARFGLQPGGQCVEGQVYRHQQLSGLVVKGVGNSPRLLLQPLVQRAQRLLRLPAHRQLADGLLLLPDNPLPLLDKPGADGGGDPVRRRLVGVQHPVQPVGIAAIPGEQLSSQHVTEEQDDPDDLARLYAARDDAF